MAAHRLSHPIRILLATLPYGRHLSHDQQQLVDTLVEQLTATLALDRHQERQQQLIVMEERATIARELHDSIAQSLSCMKMQVSCLQMQGDVLPESSRELLSQIRNELNCSWAQLRELLTTFRLQLTEPGLRPALEASCQEFSARFGFTVKLDYQLPPAWCLHTRRYTCCKLPGKPSATPLNTLMPTMWW